MSSSEIGRGRQATDHAAVAHIEKTHVFGAYAQLFDEHSRS